MTATLTEEARTKRLEWQAVKLRDRFNRAIDGYPVSISAVALADTLYGVLSHTGKPIEAMGELFDAIKAQHEAR